MQAAGGVVPDSARTDLLEEVTNLVESPTVVAGTFDERFLELPAVVLVMVMRKHQRYFPIYERAGTDAGASSSRRSNGNGTAAAAAAQRDGSGAGEASGRLCAAFATVANGAIDVDAVREGNEAVLRARFQDAQFFYEEDLKHKLEDFVPKLAGTHTCRLQLAFCVSYTFVNVSHSMLRASRHRMNAVRVAR